MGLLYFGLDSGLCAFCLKKARLAIRRPDGRGEHAGPAGK